MLGERRSKAAFSAGFPEAVREETRQDSGHLTEEIMAVSYTHLTLPTT
mgnify:CR=1 FL=1